MALTKKVGEMALHIPIRITERRSDGTIGLVDIEEIEILRLEPLHNPEDPDDEIHSYRVRGQDGVMGHFRHRYGDGAVACVAHGLAVLNAIRLVEGSRKTTSGS